MLKITRENIVYFIDPKFKEKVDEAFKYNQCSGSFLHADLMRWSNMVVDRNTNSFLKNRMDLVDFITDHTPSIDYVPTNWDLIKRIAAMHSASIINNITATFELPSNITIEGNLMVVSASRGSGKTHFAKNQTLRNTFVAFPGPEGNMSAVAAPGISFDKNITIWIDDSTVQTAQLISNMYPRNPIVLLTTLR